MTAGSTTGYTNVTCYSVTITTPGSYPVYIGTGGSVNLAATVEPSGTSGTYSWSQISGPGGGTFSSPNSASTSFSAGTPGFYAVEVEFSAGGGSDADVSGDIVFINVSAINVDAANETNTIINYQIQPAGAIIDAATFSAPGKTETRYNLSGNFYFTFNQNDLDWDYEGEVTPQPIQLDCYINGSSETVGISATRTRRQTDQVIESVEVFFPVANVGWRFYPHKLLEIYDQVNYSISYSGKTIWVGTSMAALFLNVDYYCIENNDWTENHRFIYAGGSTPVSGMISAFGMGNLYTRYKECFNNMWPMTDGLNGIATVVSLLYHHDTGVAAATFIINANVDCSIP